MVLHGLDRDAHNWRVEGRPVIGVSPFEDLKERIELERFGHGETKAELMKRLALEHPSSPWELLQEQEKK
jgi:hypothetical protein